MRKGKDQRFMCLQTREIGQFSTFYLSYSGFGKMILGRHHTPNLFIRSAESAPPWCLLPKADHGLYWRQIGKIRRHYLARRPGICGPTFCTFKHCHCYLLPPAYNQNWKTVMPPQIHPNIEKGGSPSEG
jgi:hypothetical protein